MSHPVRLLIRSLPYSAVLADRPKQPRPPRPKANRFRLQSGAVHRQPYSESISDSRVGLSTNLQTLSPVGSSTNLAFNARLPEL